MQKGLRTMCLFGLIFLILINSGHMEPYKNKDKEEKVGQYYFQADTNKNTTPAKSELPLETIPLISTILNGCINGSNNKVDQKKFLLIDRVKKTYTELVSGNYTDSHICSDFPMYWINEQNMTLRDYEHRKVSNFSLVYGTGYFADGLTESGGASGLEYIWSLPFNDSFKVKIGMNKYLDINLLVTNNLKVYINDTYILLPGESINYSYDYEARYENYESNETCVIRYYGVTEITNYGLWDESQIIFRE